MGVREVNLPDIGEGVTEGEMVKWLVAIGDKVEADQPVAEVMTDKATVEVPTPVPGTITEFLVSEGDIIPIESAMFKLDASNEDVAVNTPEPSPAVAATPTNPALKPTSPPVGINSPPPVQAEAKANELNSPATQIVSPPKAASHVLATPSTRRLAREMGIDINLLKGSGLAGRVTREDIMGSKSVTSGAGAVAAGPPTVSTLSSLKQPIYQESASPLTEERVPLRGIRRKIAKQMQLTKQVVPHFTIMDEVDISELVRVRSQAKVAGAEQGIKVTYLPFIMKALISTLRAFPECNASIDDEKEEIVYKKFYNIGFAADTPQGLLVPVIKNADQKSILQLSAEILELAGKAKEGKLSRDEMTGATITITNIGSIGGTYATPIINHPEVAIIGVYKIQNKPEWNGTEFVPTQMQNYTMTCDHRLIDGAVAARFLSSFLGRINSMGQFVLELR